MRLDYQLRQLSTLWANRQYRCNRLANKHRDTFASSFFDAAISIPFLESASIRTELSILLSRSVHFPLRVAGWQAQRPPHITTPWRGRIL